MKPRLSCAVVVTFHASDATGGAAHGPTDHRWQRHANGGDSVSAAVSDLDRPLGVPETVEARAAFVQPIILLLLEQDGHRSAVPRGNARAKVQAPRVTVTAPEPRIEKPSPQAVAAVSTTPAAAVQSEIVSTRRAPRFLVRNPINVMVESGNASLVDMSVLGAQIVSVPVLRPNQKIKVDLTDENKTLSVVAHVAWSMFEKAPTQAEPHYRVGLEFTGAAQQALEKYRQRHCTAQPIPIRTR
jgi:hypothetical protein